MIWQTVKRYGSLTVFVFAFQPVLADGADLQADGAREPITIVITPRWTEEAEENRPGTTQVLQADTLEDNGIADTHSLQNVVPGLVFKTNVALGQPYLRGLGSDIISLGTEPAVATFLDGYYLPRAAQSLQTFFDLDRVEVLKGPQGLHLGRNVLGGAMSLLTADPQPTRGAEVEAVLGDYDRRQMQLTLNEPLHGGQGAIRLSALASRRDGYVTNGFLGRDVDDEDRAAWRLKYRYAPNEVVSATWMSQWIRNDGAEHTAWSPDPDVPGSTAIVLGGRTGGDAARVFHNREQSQRVRQNLHSFRLTRRLGSSEFTSATSIQRTRTNIDVDLDGTHIDFARNLATEHTEAFTQELRYRSDDPSLEWHWTTGLFALYERANQAIDVSLPLALVSNATDSAVRTRSWSAFGELRWTPDTHWSVSTGLRYTRDKRSLTLERRVTDPFGATGPAGTTQVSQREQESWEAITPEIAVAYRSNDRTLYWTRLSSGFKSGGYNTTAPQDGFDPEKLNAWEAGIKHRSRSLDLSAELALFHYDYRDMQLRTAPEGAPVGTFPSVINAARSTVNGIELTTRFVPMRRLNTSLSVALLDARFDDFVSRDANRPEEDPDHSGGRLPQAPKVTANLHIDYAWSVAGWGRFVLSGGYHYRSDVFYNPYEDPAGQQDGFGLLNAGLKLEGQNGKWSIQLFGNNLSNETYWKQITRQDPLVGTLLNPGPPRSVGIRLKTSF